MLINDDNGIIDNNLASSMKPNVGLEDELSDSGVSVNANSAHKSRLEREQVTVGYGPVHIPRIS